MLCLTVALLLGAVTASPAANTVPQVSGYNSTHLGSAAINAPSSCGSYITYVAHPANNYDPSLCAADCANQRAETTPYNGLRCHFFNTYQLLENGVVQNQICALYSRSWDSSFATNTGYQSGGDTYTVQASNSYSLESDPGSCTCPQGNSGSAPSPAPSGPLTSCPQDVSYIVPFDRTLYKICVDTDYQIPSPQVLYGIQNNRYCADQCDSQSGCDKAVYNYGTQTCYLKGNGTTAQSSWEPNSGFQTLDKVPEGISGTQCLAPLYTIKQNGITYLVCPSSIINYPAPNIWYGVPGEYECAAKCQSVSDCHKFSYNWNTQTCYDVGNPSVTAAPFVTQYGVNAYWEH